MWNRVKDILPKQYQYVTIKLESGKEYSAYYRNKKFVRSLAKYPLFMNAIYWKPREK